MKTFGWIILIIEILAYAFHGDITNNKPLELPMVLIDSAFIISATALIIAGNFKHDKKENKE